MKLFIFVHQHVKYLGYFCCQSCRQELSKIAQYGHTVNSCYCITHLQSFVRRTFQNVCFSFTKRDYFKVDHLPVKENYAKHTCFKKLPFVNRECTYLCLHKCTYVCSYPMYAQMSICMYLSMLAQMYMCMNLTMNAQMYTCMHKCTHVCTNVHMYVPIYVCTYIDL